MRTDQGEVRVLYSFPHRLGASRICYTAWQQVSGLAAAGAHVVAWSGSIQRPLARRVLAWPTLARGRVRLPYRLFGTVRTCEIHDRIVARRLKRLAGQIDIVHAWPLGARHTLKAAARLRIPTVLERPNAHTRFAYRVVKQECDRLGVALPSGHEHAFKADVLGIEEAEYRLADYLLCPSDFVAKTFADEGVPPDKLRRHAYGFDETTYYPQTNWTAEGRGLRMIFVGACAVRKGLHFALEAWLRSSASRTGSFAIAGEFLPAYYERLRPSLSHPSVSVLGHRHDVANLMRQSDILVLPSIEEGSALVAAEAIGSGCVPLVSDRASGLCHHLDNSLVHSAGDVDGLRKHIDMLDGDRELLRRLRDSCMRLAPQISWRAAGSTLLQVYREVIEDYSEKRV